MCFVHTPDNLRKKLDAKSSKAIFVGYPLDTKGYKVYDLALKRFIRSRNVLFHEEKFHDFELEKEQVVFQEIYESGIENIEQPTQTVQCEQPVVPENVQPVGATYEETFMRQVENLDPQRRRKAPHRYHPDGCLITDSLTIETDEPKTLSEALSSEHSGLWRDALNLEYKSLIDNDTWDLVPPPNGVIVGSKWVFKVKRDVSGELDRFKARLVAQGYSQSQGTDYDEVFAPVARYSAIRSLLALANAKDWEIHQLDVKSAYLNGTIDTDIYMIQPEGFVDSSRPDYVCKLKRSLYGLKQSARCWYNTLDEFLVSSGYCKSNADNCIYIKSVKKDDGEISFVILSVYVDDLMPISNDIEMLKVEKACLCEKFEMVDQGEVHSILGMLIKRDRAAKTLFISQPSYSENTLKRLGMENCKPGSTPLEVGKKFCKLTEGAEPFDSQTYQKAIGCLTYASTATRPDIAAAVALLSKYSSNPGKEHWMGVKCIFRYIKGTLKYGLKFSADNKEGILHGFSDADWVGDIDTRRSTSGYVFKVTNATVSWCSKRQASVAKSTTEAEYISLSLAAQEAILLRRLLFDIGCDVDSPTVIYEDNHGAIELSKNPKFHNRTKHIDISHHFIRERVLSKEILVNYCPTDNMTADIMTKGLSRNKFEKFRDLLSVYPVD